MPAVFLTMTAPGDKSKREVEGIFIEEQAIDRVNNRQGFSGSWAMCSGLKFHVGNGSLFHDAQSAFTYLHANCEKWKEAVALQYKNGDNVEWMIGAWCAS